MIDSLSINGLKCFSKQTIPFSPLTVLTGLNNSGKSTVLQALRMICIAHEGGNPLLSGHGSVAELRSRSVLPTDPIELSILEGRKVLGSLVITDKHVVKPEAAPTLAYLSADRWGPRVSYPIHRSIGSLPDLGVHGEFVASFLEAFGDVLVPDLLHHPNSQGATVRFEVQGWLNDVAPGVELLYSTDEKRDSSHIEFDSRRPTNVGFGLSYVLPVLASLLAFNSIAGDQGWEAEWGARFAEVRQRRGLLLMIENPEAHLHPRGQTAIGRLLALASSLGVQVVVETQSDHLIDGIRLAVKEGKVPAEKVAFHYLSRIGTKIELESPELMPDGKLTFWPKGFFDQTLQNRAMLAR